MMHIVSQRKLIFIYLLLKTRLDAFVAETRSDATRGCVCLRSSTAFICSKCFILAAPKRASAVAFRTQFERSRNAFGTMKKTYMGLCVEERHIFCALVCTNKHAGQKKSLDAVLKAFKTLLSKHVKTPTKEENGITYYADIGLCAAVNSEPYEDDDHLIPASGVNELIYGILESLTDERVYKWCMVVLENKGFWNEMSQKMSGVWSGAKEVGNVCQANGWLV